MCKQTPRQSEFPSEIRLLRPTSCRSNVAGGDACWFHSHALSWAAFPSAGPARGALPAGRDLPAGARAKICHTEVSVISNVN